ncbi:uncharacterized protein [Ptychodera flava]|uniref:uncharacterized protein n=1 Tax=Ptychodera flava TaxID=63121 RepID=UPI00396A7B1E
MVFYCTLKSRYIKRASLRTPAVCKKPFLSDFAPGAVFAVDTACISRHGCRLVQHRRRFRVEFEDALVPEDDELKKYEYPFENLVFEGGGVKGVAYHGTLKVLSSTGIFPKIKRFAGASIGSITAALLSVCYGPDEVCPMVAEERDLYLEDHSCGILSLLPNFVGNYGWNPGKTMYEWLGQKFEAKTGNKDITFREAYLKYGKELCVVVTNVNQMDVQYCHVKTTPDMPIRVAVRMSVSIPGMYQPVRWCNGEYTDFFVDGGMLVNFPIHCYDGWWLSMKREDSFLVRLGDGDEKKVEQNFKTRFTEFNSNTLGVLLYTDSDHEVNDRLLEERRECFSSEQPISRPDTTLTKKRRGNVTEKEDVDRNLQKVTDTLRKFLKILTDNDFGESSGPFEKSSLMEAFEKDGTFTEEDVTILFGEKMTLEEIFDMLDKNNDGKIDSYELSTFCERKGMVLKTKKDGFGRLPIDSVVDYLNAVQETLLYNVKKINTKECDVDRTIGVYLDYIEGTDFFMEDADRLFAIQNGARGTRAFLKYYVDKFKPSLKESE